jgi:pyridoxamine 5'-phosphate oxidase
MLPVMTAPDPIARFAASYARAIALLPPEANPTAMVISTVGSDGRPSSRYVLLKDVDARGFVFYTNLHSRKGREIAGNPHVSLCFYWAALEEQIRVEGRAEPVTSAEADEYFATRPRDSQIGAWASDQSAPLSSPEDLVRRFDELSTKYEGLAVPRPPHWSGLRVVPARIEFWHSRPSRLHDRELYERDGDAWRVTRLHP